MTASDTSNDTPQPEPRITRVTNVGQVSQLTQQVALLEQRTQELIKRLVGQADQLEEQVAMNEQRLNALAAQTDGATEDTATVTETAETTEEGVDERVAAVNRIEALEQQKAVVWQRMHTLDEEIDALETVLYGDQGGDPHATLMEHINTLTAARTKQLRITRHFQVHVTDCRPFGWYGAGTLDIGRLYLSGSFNDHAYMRLFQFFKQQVRRAALIEVSR